MPKIDVLTAAQKIKKGELVALPTETVYGLGASALNDLAVAKIYEAKGRPEFNPLIVHVADYAQATTLVEPNAIAKKLAEKFWPGPLTFVLNRKEHCPVSLLCSAGLDTLAIRAPNHHLAQELIKEAGVPIAAPSANKSGRVSPTKPEHVHDEFGDTIDLLDGGACEVGLESTVLDLTGDVPVILRPGAITKEMLEAELKTPVSNIIEANAKFHSPGMLKSHYAPKLPVRLNTTKVEEGQALLAFGKPVTNEHVLNLSEKGDLVEAAANLFAFMRSLDDPKYSAIAVMPIPEEGLGVAINDRLKRAAA